MRNLKLNYSKTLKKNLKENLQKPFMSHASTIRKHRKSIMLGDGLPDLSMKKFNTCNNMLSYWNDPNELVDRLRLLISSKSAGHTGHNNEIISIIEELREANIIA